MKNKNTNQPLLDDLLDVVDACARHTCISEFLVTAMAEVMASDRVQQPQVVAGASLCADILNASVQELKQSLDSAVDRYRMERGDADASER